MHEFSFSITYEEGADAYADAFIGDDSLHAEAVYSCLQPSELWRLESVTGDPAALDATEGLLLDESLDRESVSGRTCEAHRRHSLLTATGRRRVVYSYLSGTDRCDAIPVLASRYATGGLLLEVSRRGDRARWRVLLQSDEKVGMLYDTLGARLAEGLTFQFERLTEVDDWHNPLLASQSLPNEQLEVLSLAVEQGYFEAPREVTLEELADQLDIPRSTASYRLRRATAEVVTAFVDTE
jgi:predicted DNA binding protein